MIKIQNEFENLCLIIETSSNRLSLPPGVWCKLEELDVNDTFDFNKDSAITIKFAEALEAEDKSDTPIGAILPSSNYSKFDI